MSIESGAGLKVGPIGIDGVRDFLPHRYPFLLVDRILEITTPGPVISLLNPSDKVGIRTKGLKAISYGENVFQGHFPGFSIFPGVQIIEALAQVACFSIYPFLQPGMPDHGKGFSCLLTGVDNARFRKPVVPGDLLILEAEVTRFRGTLFGYHCEASVDGQKVAEVDILANVLMRGDKA